MTWRAEDPEGNEAGKIKWELVPYTRGIGLDLGCGNTKPFPHFIGVDNKADERIFGATIKPDVTVETCEKLPLFADLSIDFVFSSHLLEHIEDYRAALKEWWRLIKVGGHLCLYLPHKNLYPNIGQPGANPDHKHDFLPEDIIEAMRSIAASGGCWDLARNEDRSEGAEYSFFQVYKKIRKCSGLCRESYKEPKPAKTAAVVRYGAFGDLIQASSVFRGLKEQGFHVTLYASPKGYEVVSADPHIDRVILQDTDQVPNHELGEFFDHEKKKYDRWVNLCESVEGTWLTMSIRPSHQWPAEVKRKYLNVNYMEFQHDLAGIPKAPIRPQFYATDEEKEWAKKERESFGGDFLLMYVLAGSGVHKVWPHMDALFARLLLKRPGIRIVTVGDAICEMIEAGWENEERVIRRAGKYSIRQTMAMLDQCDMVIGPETGVVNAAANLPMPKIVFLSHSSRENLTKHWKNTAALTPDNTHCYPCHVLHYGWETCWKHEETGTAMCQFNIGIDKCWQQVERLMKKAA